MLAAGEIQGNVIPGFNTRHQVLVGVRFDPDQPEAARRWLAALIPSVSTMGEVNAVRTLRRASLMAGLGRPPTPVWVNIAFDVAGLAVLGADTAPVRDRRFRQGMGVESGLGDPKSPDHEGHPTRWVVGGSPERTPHALVILASDDEAALQDRVPVDGVPVDGVPVDGVEAMYRQGGRGLAGDAEHFGFRDGISQAGARGRISTAGGDYVTRRVIDPSDARSLRFGRPGQPLVWPGQFVFGYPRQRDDDPVQPGPLSTGGPTWMDNGSYLVFRRLRQDVAAFRRFVAEGPGAGTAGTAGIPSERLAAMLVGRWPGGTALVRKPAGDDPDPMGDRFKVNHFGYADPAEPVVVLDGGVTRAVTGVDGDRFGRVCPGFAHVRKVNPRDLPTDKGGPDRTLTFAILRRGIPWGEPYPSDPAAQAGDGGDRGLLFLCYQTSIANQFEVLNSDWMNRVNGPEGDTGHDLLVGQGSGDRRQREGHLRDGNRIVTLAEWVIPTGGGYFFAPSLSALRMLAAVP